MITIKSKTITDKLREVDVESDEDGTRISLGILNDTDRIELIRDLSSAILDLT